MNPREQDLPRERLRQAGAQALSDSELVALVLGTGIKGVDSLALARLLLDSFGGLAGLCAAEISELDRLPGLGLARSARIRVLAEVSIRLSTRRLEAGASLRSSNQVAAAYRARLAGERREVFLAVGLDAKRRVIVDTCIATGHLTGVEVHPREAFRPLIRCAAAAAIVVHNHPSGDPTPSTEDRDLTRRLLLAGQLLGIPLLDHVILGDERHVSMRADEQMFARQVDP